MKRFTVENITNMSSLMWNDNLGQAISKTVNEKINETNECVKEFMYHFDELNKISNETQKYPSFKQSYESLKG